MKELFVPFDLAFLARTYGFNEMCPGWWFGDGSSKEPHLEWRQHYNDIFIAAPTYQQLIDWFARTYDIHIQYRIGFGDPRWYDYLIQWNNGNDYKLSEEESWETSYEALSKAIEESFKLIKQ